MELAVALAFLGVTAISLGGGESNSPSLSPFWGVAFALAAGLWSALYYMGIKVMRIPNVDSLLMTFYSVFRNGFRDSANVSG